MDPGTSERVEKARLALAETEARWVKCFFTDMLGTLRAITLPASVFNEDGTWEKGKSIDGSSLAGFASVESSDVYARPDPDTVSVLPYTSEGILLARVFMDLVGSDALTPHPHCPRGIARRAEAAMRDAGFGWVKFQPELEFYLFDSVREAVMRNDLSDGLNPPGRGSGLAQLDALGSLDSELPHQPTHASYDLPPPIDRFDAFRDVFSAELEEAGIPVKVHHHECGAGQVEIEFVLTDGAVGSSDASVYYKHLARYMAAERGLRATFMPKPVASDAGSGMHFHIVAGDGKVNLFSDLSDEAGLSQKGRYFVGGLLEHARAMCAVMNPTTNSYRRLVPFAEAPTLVSWGLSNRTALIRIPARSKAGFADIEIRNPDCLCNPYLVTALMIHSGLDGIKRKLDPGSPQVDNLYHLSPAQLKAKGIKTLPRSLREAVFEFNGDEVIRNALGHTAHATMVELLERRVLESQRRVPSWEILAHFDG